MHKTWCDPKNRWSMLWMIWEIFRPNQHRRRCEAMGYLNMFEGIYPLFFFHRPWKQPMFTENSSSSPLKMAKSSIWFFGELDTADRWPIRPPLAAVRLARPVRWKCWEKAGPSHNKSITIVCMYIYIMSKYIYIKIDRYQCIYLFVYTHVTL